MKCDSEVYCNTLNGSDNGGHVLCVNNTAQQIASKGLGVDSTKEDSQGQGTSSPVCVDDSKHEGQGLLHRGAYEQPGMSQARQIKEPATSTNESIENVQATQIVEKGCNNCLELDILHDFDLIMGVRGG